MRFTTLIAKNLVRRGVRTILTIVGLSIGIAAVVAMLGIAWGFERSFLAINEAKGIDLMVVRAGVSDKLTSSLDESLAGKLQQIPGVREVAGSYMDVVSFEDANLVSVLVNGWEPGSILFRGIRILKGRALATGDGRAAVLGRVLALNLGKSVGDSLDVAGEKFQVIGIFESDSLFENGGLIVPRRVLQKMMGREGNVTGFVVMAAPNDRASLETLRKRIETTIPGIAAVPSRDYVQGDIRIRMVKAMAWTTSAIALVLGSIGVLNTMMMTVFERTVEIGLLRALGWRRKRVLALILGEALALGVAGAVVGVFLGYTEIQILSRMPTASGFVSSDFPPAVIAVGLALGVGLSLLGGVYPALRGAAMQPTEALRHE
ncbi:putative ABC transport system permease protein [Singulisphaera sp. GP187]|uniref:ABC transporter permease n=1 Tax=Singulisphaera sp. GP187 TaxID=1882752 RepID=UPI000928409C|nr:ABC transporter permease [Singulisphaera sp. GP187]SIN90125.1 putative ABC transport system permease protein [Singulisphaera sp. GP187]